MLLESVLAEFSIDDLTDNLQQMPPVKTHVSAATQEQNYSRRSISKTAGAHSLYTHRVVLEMYSSRESSCELLNNSGKLMQKHMTHLSEDYSSYKAPPFRWPGVRKSVQIEEGELRDDQLMPPGARSASGAISPSCYSIRTSSAFPEENEDYFSWNLSHLPRQSIDGFQRSLQGDNISDNEHEDIIPPTTELDAHKADWIQKSDQKATNLSADEDQYPTHNGNMELTTMASRPAIRTASASLVWGVFPCCLGKCFVAPSVKQNEKSEQVAVPVATTIEQGKVYCSSSHGLKVTLARHTLRVRAKKLATPRGVLKHMCHL